MSNSLLHINTGNIITKRVRCNYDLIQQEMMELKKQNVLNDLKHLKLSGKMVIYDNQELIASKVDTAFKDRKIINVMCLSKTQSGKTGSMCAFIKRHLEDTSNLIPIEHIYIITGLSSCEWRDQTKERMPEAIQKNVFHRCDLPNTFVEEIQNKKNILIIMDEIQVAAKKGQTIYKMFEKAGLLDKQKLYENDVKILEYTATPDGTIYDLMKWKDASAKILADVGDGYVSSYDLYRMGRVKQYKVLSGVDDDGIRSNAIENIREIKRDIDSYSGPMYHIIRTNNGLEQDMTIQNFMKVFPAEDYPFIKYDGQSGIQDINGILKTPPKKHTIIFIKEMLRCAKTLTKTHLGVLYDRYTQKPDDTTVIQGLVGRDTGYDNNGISKCYTNIESIVKYEKLWNSNFEDKTIRWNSKTTKYTKGVLTGKNTFNDPKNYKGFTATNQNADEYDETEPIIHKFKTIEEAKAYYKTHLYPVFGGIGPKDKKKVDGFYTTVIKGKVGLDRNRVRSTGEIYEIRKLFLNEERIYNFRCYPCYRDVNDKDTLEWWLIHY